MRHLIVAIGLFVTPVVAAAQFPARDTTPVPRDLAVALLQHTFFGSANPTIVVGQLPDSSVAPLVPPGARILGGIAHGSRRTPGGNSTTILEVPETPDSIMNVIESTLERLGWRRPPMMRDSGERGGFVTRSFPMAYGGSMMSVAFCSDSGLLSASASGAGDVSIVRLTLNSEAVHMCDERQNVAMRRMEMLELPTLRPPPGANPVGGHGSSGGSDYRETSVQLSSRLSAAEVIAHFAPQLEEQGWKVVNRVSQPEVGLVTATKRAENGDTLHLLLVDGKFDTRSHHASLRVWNPAARW